MLLNKVIFWKSSEVPKKVLFKFNRKSMCQFKFRDKIPRRLQMNENGENNNYSGYQWISSNGVYSYIPSFVCDQSRSRLEGSIYNFHPHPTGWVPYPWNQYFGYSPCMNYYLPYQNFYYDTPFFHNTAVQTNLYGRNFHRQLVDNRRRNYHPRETNGNGIMSLRFWEKIREKPSSKPGFIFTLMSYNVLAQDLLEQHPHLYLNNNREFLGWKTRWNNLLKEISNFSPDILCLQEVQESHIEEYFSLLETLGYKGIYKKRTGNQSDGCAIYYKTENITLIENTFVEYFQPSVTLLNRDNIGILAKFVPKLHPTREFVVATTHLLYNPKRNDVRMAQMQLLLTEIEKMSYRIEKGKSFYVPVLVTGDLNSSPDSDLYEFITKGELKYEHLSPRLLEADLGSSSRRVLVTSRLGITDTCQRLEQLEIRQNIESNVNEEKCRNELENIKIIGDNKVKLAKKCHLNSKGILSHNFYFKSVYNHGGAYMNEGTTHQDEWLTVDYIFYSMKNEKSEGKLQLISRYRLPTKDELDEVRIPNKQLGSDHLSLVAKFKLEF
nr:protein angel homolog 2 isoform X1 [Leptinotarsa decemlineata]